MSRTVRIAVISAACLPASAWAHALPSASPGWEAVVGRFHPALVHFPVALVLVALVAEGLCIARRDGRYADIARFMIIVAAWISVPAAITGFLRAESVSFDAMQARSFSIHRVAGIATPVLVFLCAGLGEGVRRSGQIWELALYRVVMVLAALAAAVAGYFGGEIVFGVFSLW